MEFDHDNVRRRAIEEDRFSSLPDELIHRIFSRLDIKYGVQTCVLSSRWKLVWTTMPCLNFSTQSFRVLRIFAKFVNHVVSHRNHQIKLSSVTLHVRGRAVNQGFVKKIAKYAFSHDVEKLIVLPVLSDYVCPPCLSSSKSLKDFTLMCHTAKTHWDFPALTTLNLNCEKLTWDDDGRNLFSKCVNLRNLTLHELIVKEAFDIATPRLCNLVLNTIRCSKPINVIAPQLENLTMNKCSIRYLNVSPKLSSFCYTSWVGFCAPLCFSNDGFFSLNKVRICLSCLHESYKPYKEDDARKTITMLQKLHSARYLTLSAQTLECISSFPDLLSQHSSSFSNLICLTIDSSMIEDDAYKVKMSTEASNFLLDNSPTATLIIK